MYAIQTNQLSKYYGKVLGIKDVTLEVEQGEIFGFIGPNGAGKSTAIRTILGLLIPTSGTAKLFGEDMQVNGAALRQRVGYLPSEVNYYEGMTSLELLKYSARFYENSNGHSIDELAELLELDLHKKIRDLSFGNKKKVGIIQSLIHRPDLIILDEPTSGLDPLIRNHFFELLHRENKRGVTIFISSHVLSEIQRLCSRAAIIRQGEVTAVEDIHELLKKQMKRVHLMFAARPEGLTLPTGSQNERWRENALNFEYIGPVAELLKWMSSLDLLDASMEEPDLETIFMNYYER